jgi:hypothetical protein
MRLVLYIGDECEGAEKPCDRLCKTLIVRTTPLSK